MGALRAAIILVCHVGYHTEGKIFATFLTLLDRPEGFKKKLKPELVSVS